MVSDSGPCGNWNYLGHCKKFCLIDWIIRTIYISSSLPAISRRIRNPHAQLHDCTLPKQAGFVYRSISTLFHRLTGFSSDVSRRPENNDLGQKFNKVNSRRIVFVAQLYRHRALNKLAGSDLPGVGFNPPNDFLIPRVYVDLSSWGVDSNSSVSVTC